MPVIPDDPDFREMARQSSANADSLLQAQKPTFGGRATVLSLAAGLGHEAIWLTQLAHGGNDERVLATQQRVAKILAK